MALRMVIYDSVLFNRTGQVRRWAEAVERRFTMNARDAAPLNKRAVKTLGAPPVGTLKAGISGNVTRIGPRHLQTDIVSSAPYSLYVIRGTGTITSGSPDIEDWRSWMYVPPNPGFGGVTRQQTVSGQAPNNFLGTAARLTAARHPSLRGFNAQTFRSF
jgi:hypothetical protein